jgi:biofilm PGA synthesis lipoprotein PgaB
MRLLPLSRRGTLSLAAALALPRGTAAQPGPGRFAAIAYHEVGEDGRDRHYSISESMLVQHLSFLRHDGWSFVGLDDLLAARDGRRPLPEKAVLLSFDDGYDDYFTRVFPLLRAFAAPAVFALVTSWMETPPGGSFDYGGTPMPRRALMSWAEARQMQASGLCEFASHSHDLHRGILANPQGNTQPAAVTRAWLGTRYETDAEWRRRIEEDLARASAIMAQRLGRRPRCLVWPYGRHNLEGVGIARRLGMPVTLTLDPEPASAARLDRVGRILAMGDPRVADLARMLRFDAPVRERVLVLPLAALHDADPAVAAARLDALIERLAFLSPSHVWLDAAADADGDGRPDSVFFPNRAAPLRADLLNRVAWQVATRAGVEPYALLPLAGWPQGVAVATLAEDLAKHAPVAGLVLAGAAEEGEAAAIVAGARRWRSPLAAVRLLPPGGMAGYAEALAAATGPHDRVALLVAEGVAEETAAAVTASGGVARTVLLLEAAAGGAMLPASRLRARLRRLQRLGLHHLGWAPDDPLRGLPEAAAVQDAISARAFPFRRR